MQLKSISLQNFRSYREEITIRNLPQISIMIGRNNAGKSNLIKALDWYASMSTRNAEFAKRLLHSGNRDKPLIMDIQLEVSHNERESVLQLLRFNNSTVERAFQESPFLTNLRHIIQFNSDGYLDNEKVWATNFRGDWFKIWENRKGNGTEMQFWFNNIDEKCARLSSPTDLEQSDQNNGRSSELKRAFSWKGMSPAPTKMAQLLSDFLSRVRWISPLRSVTPRVKPAQETELSTNGNNLLRVLHTLQGEEMEKYADLKKEVYTIVPGLSGIRNPLRGDEVAAVFQEPDAVEVEIDEVGTGLEQTLILVSHLLLSPENSLLLIEEPENNLHASAQRALFRLLKKLLNRNHQFVITTHSTIFTESSDTVATFLLDKKQGASSIRRLEDSTELISLKQALGHENTDLFGFNAVFIIEGETEEKCMPLIASSLKLNLSKMGLKLLSIGGSGTSKRIDELLQYLKDSDTLPFIMLDSHSAAIKQKDKWIAGGLVEEDDIFLLEKEFEDCFPDELLVKAMIEVAKRHDSTLSPSDVELINYRKSNENKSISRYLQKIYHDRTGHALSKSELGEMIGRMLLFAGEWNTPLQPEEMLKKIVERLNSRR